MAWTAAIGRSHFEHRAGVVFGDAQALREGLARVASNGGVHKSQWRGKPAFVYSGETGDDWMGYGQALFESEPVARAVLERCDAVLREERGMSLLDTNAGRAAISDDPVLTQTAVYALQCALTALWSSLGVLPGVVHAGGFGEIAAARAAGVVDLETGTLLAARRGELVGADGRDFPPEDVESFLKGILLGPAQIPLSGRLSGETIQPGATPDRSIWSAGVLDPAESGALAIPADLEAAAIVEIGPGCKSDYIRSVARAYEAGLALDFAGLFAGEARRRISVPGYPFQRRSFWFTRS